VFRVARMVRRLEVPRRTDHDLALAEAAVEDR
jgi:hypothetical protein